MEAFKEHIQKQQFALLEYSKVLREGIIKMQKIGWKAALKMIMRHEMHRYGNDFMTDKPMNVLYDFIRKELEN